MKYSIASIARNAPSQHANWPQAWRSPEPKPFYDADTVGPQRLATALSRSNSPPPTRLENRLDARRNPIDGTIIRSNYLLEGNAHFYEWSLKLWHGLSADLNYNVMFSPRGVLNLAHSDAQRDAFMRRGNAMRLNGIDAEWLGLDQVRREVPLLDCSDNQRYPIVGGLMQRREASINDYPIRDTDRKFFWPAPGPRHHPELRSHRLPSRAPRAGVETSRGYIGAGKVGLAVAGHSSHVGAGGCACRSKPCCRPSSASR
jgi:sarcosine oxidase subunit beta